MTATPIGEITGTMVVHCDGCDSFFREGDEGEACYRCSRCDNTTLERRCPDCNIFTAKESLISCPDCEGPIEDGTEAVERWETDDGEWHDSPETAAAWIEGEPERQAAYEASRAASEARMAEMRVEEKARADALLPGLLRLWGQTLEAGAPELHRTIGYAIESARRGTTGNIHYLYLAELVRLLAPGEEAERKIAICEDYSITPHTRVEPHEAWLRDRVLDAIAAAPGHEAPSITSRVTDRWFTVGTGLGFDTATVIRELGPVVDHAKTPS